MKCTQCQHENPAGWKFCGECGARLGGSCPRCGSLNLPAQKFCGECGAPLTAAEATKLAAPDAYTPRHLAEKILTSRSAIEGERKPVTVLFCDVVSPPHSPSGSARSGCTRSSAASSKWPSPRSTATRERSTSSWAMGSWRSSGRRWRTRITRAARYWPRSTCGAFCTTSRWRWSRAIPCR